MLKILDKIKLLFLKFLIVFSFFLNNILNANQAIEPYSNDELIELKKQFITEINQSDKVLRNPLITEFINHLGNKLSREASMAAIVFFVVNSQEINAFAGPGGYIGINSQLILATRTESELAAVMSHEIAHVKLHHLYRMIEHQKNMRIPMMAAMLAAIALGSIDPSLAGSAALGTLSGFAQDSINFTRSNEKEADSIGIKILIKANFDPMGMVSFFQKMQENSRYYYSANTPAILRTHPLDDERIAEAINRIPKEKLSIYEESDYYTFKELIRNEVVVDHKNLLDFYKIRCKQQNNNSDQCNYGYSLALLKTGKLSEADYLIQQLLKKNPNNLFYNMASLELLIRTNNILELENTIKKLTNISPDSYSVLYSAGLAYFKMQKFQAAETILLKAKRRFPNNIQICKTLAQVQAKNKKIANAYLTEASCSIAQGYNRDAISKLRLAKTYIKHKTKQDKYLTNRIDAMIDDLKTKENIRVSR